MLRHMRREQAFIQERERRTHRQPDQENAHKKTRGTPRRDSIRGGRTKVTPTAQIEDGRKNCGEGKRNRHRPGSENALNRVWHGALTLRNRSRHLAFLERRVTRRRLPRWMQGRQKCDQRRRLRWAQVLSIRRHVAAAL